MGPLRDCQDPECEQKRSGHEPMPERSAASVEALTACDSDTGNDHGDGTGNDGDGDRDRCGAD
eukprot:15441764-Alexandrium_andersonii.AAC.1